MSRKGVVAMRELEHNIVGMLYPLKERIHCYLIGTFDDSENGFESRLHSAEEVLEKANVQVARVLEMVKRIGCMEQTNGNPNAIRMKVSIEKTWLNVVKLLRKEISLNEIEMIVRMPKDFPAIYCDRDDLKEILYHLIKNAVQA